MGDLRIYDFSLMRFHKLGEPTPPRKQMLTIEGLALDEEASGNDELTLRFAGAVTGSVSVDVTAGGTLGVGGLAADGYTAAARIEVHAVSGTPVLFGMLAQTGRGEMNPIKEIANTGTVDVILTHLSVSAASPKDRFSLHASYGSSYTLAPGHAIGFGGGYDYADELWKVPASAGATPAFASESMPTLSVSGRQVVASAGYAALLDGGSDDFMHDPSDTTTTVDSIITFSSPSSGRFKRRNRDPVVDLKKAGVTGAASDQSTKITNAITAALDLASESGTGNAQVVQIELPPGLCPRVETPISLPGNIHKRVRFSGAGWRTGSQAVYGDSSWDAADLPVGGSVIRVAPGITAFDIEERDLDLRDLAIVGLNGVGTRRGIAELNAKANLSNVFFGNLTTGMYRDGTISPPHMNNVRFYGCQTGMHLFNCTDLSISGFESQGCDLGLLVERVASLSLTGRSLFQSNVKAIEFKDAWFNIVFDQPWFEQNSAHNVYVNPVGITGSGGVHFKGGTRFGTQPVQMVLDVGVWLFEMCGPWFSQNGGSITLIGGMPGSPCTWTNGDLKLLGANMSQNPYSFVTSGAFDLNYLSCGPDVSNLTQLSGNITFNAFTNFPYNSTLSVTIQQDAVGGRTVSFSGIKQGPYSDTGNSALNVCTIEFESRYGIGQRVKSFSGWVTP
jgi:hypothetical protein